MLPDFAGRRICTCLPSMAPRQLGNCQARLKPSATRSQVTVSGDWSRAWNTQTYKLRTFITRLLCYKFSTHIPHFESLPPFHFIIVNSCAHVTKCASTNMHVFQHNNICHIMVKPQIFKRSAFFSHPIPQGWFPSQASSTTLVQTLWWNRSCGEKKSGKDITKSSLKFNDFINLGV